MAKILISYFSDSGESTYDAISQALLKEGNDLLRVNIRGWINYKSWTGASVLRETSLIKLVTDFDPDIILNFSHSLPLEVCDVLSSRVKNCLIDGDNPNLFWNIEYLKKNISKYYFFGMQTASREMYREILGVHNDDQYVYFPPATLLESSQEKKDKNISFIGSPFFKCIAVPDKNLLTEDFYDVYKKIKGNYTITSEHLSDDLRNRIGDVDRYMNWIRFYVIWQERFNHLTLLTDLGLHIYGLRDWSYARFYDAQLGEAFNSKVVRTLEDNQAIYNSSKICINISHPQAKTAFSWRVMDIMASSACVLTEYKEDWEQLFAPYISLEVRESMVYKDRYEMRAKAKKLLEDDSLRERCVLESNAAIKKIGRWRHRFVEVEKSLGLQLIDNPKASSYQFLEAIEKKAPSKISLFFRQRKRELDIFIYGVILLVSLLPVFNLCISRGKIIDKINKRIPR